MAYFERLGPDTYRATGHVSGAWDTETQHIAPALGLLAHAVEADRVARGRNDLVPSRLSYDILGTVPVAVVGIAVRVLRPGRTVELVEATLTHGGRDVVVLRAWLLRPYDTVAWEGTPVAGIAPPEQTPPWDPSSRWPGGFIASAEVRRTQVEPGRAAFWVRTPVPLIADEQVDTLASAAGLLDIANGMTVREPPEVVTFPNVDTTVHLWRELRGEWLGFDTRVSFGPGGLGLTSSVLHDTTGPVGTVAQSLTVRPR